MQGWIQSACTDPTHISALGAEDPIAMSTRNMNRKPIYESDEEEKETRGIQFAKPKSPGRGLLLSFAI